MIAKIHCILLLGRNRHRQEVKVQVLKRFRRPYQKPKWAWNGLARA